MTPHRDLCALIRDESTVLADLIRLSHTPPIWLAIVGFLFHTIQSALFSGKISLILLLSISFMHSSRYFSAQVGVLELSKKVVALNVDGAAVNKGVPHGVGAFSKNRLHSCRSYTVLTIDLSYQ